MLGLRTAASLRRRAQTGQGADGSSIIGETTAWSGKVYVSKGAGSGKYRSVGIGEVGTYTVFMPFLTGTARPIIGDRLVCGDDSYYVEYVDPGTEGIRHHLELTVRRTEP